MAQLPTPVDTKMNRESGDPLPRIAREKRTVAAMIRIYCRAHHAADSLPCDECRTLLDYAECRLERCPYGAEKPTCADCPIHCYQPAMRDRVRRVMRYAGPRMLFRHPTLAVGHLLDGIRGRRDQKPPNTKR